MNIKFIPSTSNRSLRAMVLNAGLEMGLDPKNKDRRYEQLVGEVRQLYLCSEIEALKLILSTNEGGGANVSNH